MGAKLNRTGEEYVNKKGEKIRIIKYNDSTNCDVLFLDYGWIEKMLNLNLLEQVN